MKKDKPSVWDVDELGMMEIYDKLIQYDKQLTKTLEILIEKDEILTRLSEENKQMRELLLYVTTRLGNNSCKKKSDFIECCKGFLEKKLK